MSGKVALVHDWLTGMRGGEKVLEIFCGLYPQADVFTLLHAPGSVSKAIEGHKITTSRLQRFPGVERNYRYLLPWMPRAIEALDLRGYSLVVSTSHCVAKGCRPDPDALHVCYCFTPMRYIWDQYDHYFAPGRSSWPVRAAMRVLRPRLQAWDVRSARRVGAFVADSGHVRNRIQSYYGRGSEVIYPPADLEFYSPADLPREDFYLIVSALAPYKRIEIAVQAFNVLGLKLKIIGSGPARRQLQGLARGNVEFLGWMPDADLRDRYRRCRALIFPGEEDFGIVPVEAQACGSPVIAYGKGGALETVVAGATGLFFPDPTPASLRAAVEEFESKSWDSRAIRSHALGFSRDRFVARWQSFVLTLQKNRGMLNA